MKVVIVSRHPATVKWLAEKLAGEVVGNTVVVSGSSISVLASATAEDVRGAMVYGNLPFHLAVLAHEVGAVEFTGTPPRGQEYTIEDMEKAGAKIVWYQVTRL